MTIALYRDGEKCFFKDLEEAIASIDANLKETPEYEHNAAGQWLFFDAVEDQFPVSMLEASVNLETGYGGVI
ncbi:hypothetical protein AB0E70_27375 [Streptomyces murinus]|uniref:hypothetical protein n=1 Tax=Streptomyces murinus TaxID=33900 RepID=UPI000A3AB282|nr:hypothetical protein [Streptomyces murinus]